ncbi:MAG: CRTAC1 family protein [Acidobacteriaceae bacterium]
MAALRIRSTSAVLLLTFVASLVPASSQVASSHSLQSNSRTAAPSAAATSGLPQLVDITKSTGIEFSHLSSPEAKYVVESMSGGVALIDYNRDGWPDIYFTNAPSVDMALAGKKARSALYRNNHDGTFTDVSDQAELGNDSQWAMGAAFGDYDGDGWADLFVDHYVDLNLNDLPTFGSRVTCKYHAISVQCGPRGLKGSPDNLYHNNGDGTFTDVSKQAGVDDAQGLYGLTAVWSDFNDDGRLDLFVDNDGEPTYLYRNDGKGHFTDIAYTAGVAVDQDGNAQANMGTALGDYNHTGRFSIAITHFNEQYAALFRNDGNMNFTDVSYSSGIAQSTTSYVGWGDEFIDFDNDGWDDFFMVNGHVYPQVDSIGMDSKFREPKLLFLNQRDGKFQNISKQVGPAIQELQVSRGVAMGDLFNNGKLDLVVENLEGGPMILAPQGGPPNHWISLQLEGTKSNRLALNARVTTTAGELVQTGEVLSGGSYLSQNDLRIHFGLGSHDRADKLEIHWPDGTKQTFTNVSADHLYQVTEGKGIVPVDYAHP